MHLGELGRALGGGLAVGERVQLTGDQDQADPGEHALDHREGYRAEQPAEPGGAHGELEQAGGGGDHAERGETVVLDRAEDEHGQAGGGPGHLQAIAIAGAGQDQPLYLSQLWQTPDEQEFRRVPLPREPMAFGGMAFASDGALLLSEVEVPAGWYCDSLICNRPGQIWRMPSETRMGKLSRRAMSRTMWLKKWRARAPRTRAS